jgi:hypothetical protein
MPQPYNMTNVTDANNLLDIVTATSGLVDDMLGVFILVLVWVVTFISLKNYYTSAAIVTAGFLTMISSIMLFIIGLISQQILLMCIVLFAVSIIYAKISS